MNPLLFVVSLCLIGMAASQVYPGNKGGLPNADTACSQDQAKQGQKAINQMCTSMDGFIPSATSSELKPVQDCIFKETMKNSGECFQMTGSEKVTFQTLCDGSKTEERRKIACCYAKQMQTNGKRMDFDRLAQQCFATNPLSGMGRR